MPERTPETPLFTPTLEDAVRVERPPGQRPWHLQHQFYVAFFGGTLPITWIAYKNAERLGMPLAARRRIALVGGVTTAVVVVVLAWLAADPARLAPVAALFPGARPTQIVRLLIRACAVVLYLVFAAWQKPVNRLYMSFGKGEYDSLWRPGVVAVVVGDVIVIAAFVILMGALVAIT